MSIRAWSSDSPSSKDGNYQLSSRRDGKQAKFPRALLRAQAYGNLNACKGSTKFELYNKTFSADLSFDRARSVLGTPPDLGGNTQLANKLANQIAFAHESERSDPESESMTVTVIVGRRILQNIES